MYVPEPILILFMIIGLISVVIVFTAPWTVIKRVVVIDTKPRRRVIHEALPNVEKVYLYLSDEQYRAYTTEAMRICSMDIGLKEKQLRLIDLIKALQNIKQ